MLTYGTLNSVFIDKGLQDFFMLLHSFFIHFLCLGIFLQSHFFQKLFVFLFQNHSISGKQILVWSDHKTFANVVLNVFKSQQCRNGRVKLCIDFLKLLKCAFSVNWYVFEHIFHNGWNLCDLSPGMELFTDQSDIKYHKLVLWCIVNSRLDSSLAVPFGPKSTKILPIDLDPLNFLILLQHVHLDLLQIVMKSLDSFVYVEEILLEKWLDIIDWNWDFVSEEIVPPGILDSIATEIIDNGEVRAVNFLSGDPEDIRLIKTGLVNSFDELGIRV